MRREQSTDGASGGDSGGTCDSALILIDVINDLEFEGGERLQELARPVAQRIAGLKSRARDAGIPVIYANDNFGRWRSDFRSLIGHCLRDGVRGRFLAETLHPTEDDYFVLKPKHSAFFATSLQPLLADLHSKTLLLTGITGDMCVLFTAMDAYLRDYRLVIPEDCVVSLDPAENLRALEYAGRVLDADTRSSGEIDLEGLIRGQRRPRRQEIV